MTCIKSEMYQAGWNDFMYTDGDCNFPADNDYLEGWQNAEEAVFEIRMETELELKSESYFDY